MPHGKESQCVVGSDRRRLDEVILRGREKEEAEATRLKAATDAEANAGRGKCVSRPESFGETLAAIRGVSACAGGYVAAFGRILERKGLVAAAVIISSQVKLILTP